MMRILVSNLVRRSLLRTLMRRNLTPGLLENLSLLGTLMRRNLTPGLLENLMVSLPLPPSREGEATRSLPLPLC